MRFVARHTTQYHFSRPVFLEPHFIRLTPRQDLTQRLVAFNLDIDPLPAGRFDGLDEEGNACIQVWFDGFHDHLDISTHFEAITLRTNPFGFLLEKRSQCLPVALSAAQSASLSACLTRAWADSTASDELAYDIQGNVQSSLDFLLQLNMYLFEHLEKIERHEPGILSPRKVLSEKKGACRDTACVFVDCCRAVGIPARFVSGYQSGDPDVPYNELHAWAEVFLPGPGWLGFDPTHGLVAADDHLALAASHDPMQAAPLLGTFRGTDAHSTLTHQVVLERVEEGTF